MVLTFTTLAVILTRIACIWGPLVPIRGRLVRDVEDYAYNKITVTLEILVNIVIVLLSIVMLICTAAENPNVPVRVWVSVYAVQCLIHVVLVWFVYRFVARRRELQLEGLNAIAAAGGFFPSLAQTSLAWSFDFFNMSMSFVWVNVGHDWMKSGDKLLPQNTPWLYWWFTKAYLASDVMFAMIWLAGITACCCLPCFIIILRYRVRTVAIQEGAFEEDLNVLPKYRFHMSRNLETPSVGAGVIVPMDISGGDSGAERVVLLEDSECCICLCSYGRNRAPCFAMQPSFSCKLHSEVAQNQKQYAPFATTAFSKRAYELEHASNTLFTV